MIEQAKLDSINTKEGIRRHLKNLESFGDLIRKRREFHKKTGYSLNEFYIFNGMIWLDCSGRFNSGKTNLAELSEDFVFAVMTSRSFHEALQELPRKCDVSYSLGGGELPPANLFCPYCGKGWTIIDFRDFRSEPEFEIISAPVGVNIKDFIEKINASLPLYRLALTNGIKPNGEKRIRNEKHIDLRLKPTCETLKVNEFGIMEVDPETYITEEGDQIDCQRIYYYHIDCYLKKINKDVTEEMLDAVEKSELEYYSVQTIKNRYGSESYRGKWFLFDTELGLIRIGWRKRVIEIDYTRTDFDFQHLFTEERVTNDMGYVHAYGYKKLTDYLSRMIVEARKIIEDLNQTADCVVGSSPTGGAKK